MAIHSSIQRHTTTVLSSTWFLVLATVLIGWNLMLADVMIHRLHMNDFGKIYYSVVAYLEGQNMYGPNPATLMEVTPNYNQQYWNLNPPHFHLLIFPLGFLSPLMALSIWGIMNFLAGVGSYQLIAKTFPQSLPLLHRKFIFLGLLGFSGTGILFLTGQLSLLLLYPITLAWIHVRKGHWQQAGIVLGLVCSIKPFLLIFVPYLILKRQYAALVNFLLTIGALYLAGFMFFGKQVHLQWIDKLGAIDWYWATMNASILGFLTRNFSETPIFSPVMNASDLIIALWFFLGGTIAALTCWVIYADQTDQSEQTVDRAFALLLLASLLLSPLGWQYYVFFSLGPLSTMIYSWWNDQKGHVSSGGCLHQTGRNILLYLSIPGLMVPIIALKLFQPNPIATAFLGSAYFWSILFLWSSVFLDWCRKAPTPSDPFA